MRRRRTPVGRAAAATAAALALVPLVACGRPATLDPLPAASPLPSATAPEPSPEPVAVEVARWAVHGSLVSVEVRNPNAEVGLVGAPVRLVVRDRFGAAVATSPSSPTGDACCTLYELPPLGRHAVYLTVPPEQARRAAAVEVTTPGAVWRTWRTLRPARAEVRRATLRRLPNETEVHGRLTVTGARDVDVSVQVTLVDAAGRMVAVVVGLLGCYRAPRDQPVRLQLFHAVPAEVRVDDVRAYAFRAGQFPGRRRPC